MADISKHDWKLFREKLPGWQEAYMERLCREYIALLSSEQNASDKFWELDKRIKSDRKAPGVILQMDKGEMLFNLVRLVQDKVITLDDLAEFSDDVREKVAFMVQRRW